MTIGRTITFGESVEIVQHCIAHEHNYAETAEEAWRVNSNGKACIVFASCIKLPVGMNYGQKKMRLIKVITRFMRDTPLLL